MNGRFVMSDDSHGVEQVGLNYHRVLDAIRKAGIEELHFLEKETPGAMVNGGGHATSHATKVSLADLEAHPFWSVEDPSAGSAEDGVAV